MRALVIGASKGIGKGIADRLRLLHYDVVRMSRTRAPDCADPWFELDLAADPEEIDESLEDALACCGAQLDLLVMSGGAGAMHTRFEENWQRADEMMATNYLGPVQVFHRCLRPLLRLNGHAVFIGSTCASRPSAGLSLYRASKAALHAYALNQAHELRGKVLVNVVAPGWVATPMTFDLKPEIREKILKRIPAGRFATVDEVADFSEGCIAERNWDIYRVHEMLEFTTHG